MGPDTLTETLKYNIRSLKVRTHTCLRHGDMRVLSIDVGYSSLGFVYAHVRDFVLASVEIAHKIDLRDVPCVPSRDDCHLPHSANVVDRVSHLIVFYQRYFDAADLILIEAQPLGGIRDVQALLYDRFREKTQLVSPNAVHKHFDLPAGEYDQRKELVVEIATPYLTHLQTFRRLNRKHDVSDAVCLILFVMHQRRTRAVADRCQEAKRVRAEKNRATNCFEQFRFVK